MAENRMQLPPANKEWPELVGKTFAQASKVIVAFYNKLTPYNARNGVQDRMLDPTRVVCVTDDNDIVTRTPSYRRTV